MKKILTFFLVACLCIGTLGINYGGVGVYAASTKVHHIVTNPAENCSTAMNIGFHANTGCTGCYVQYTTADDTSWAKAKTQSGSYKTYGASTSSNPFYNQYAKQDDGTNYYQTPTFLDYSVTLSGLMANTNYIYRIYDGSAYSNTYSFKTAATSGDWSFVVTGDFHEYYANYGVDRAGNATKAIDAAISLATQKGYPAVEHIVSVGDIVAWGVDYNQWQNVFDLPWIKKYSFANSVGNHDAMDRSSPSNYTSKYNSIMNNYPLNGYGDEVGTCYYYLYNNVLFIYINYLDTSSTAEAWVDSVISSMAGKYQYSVLVNHRPATSKYNAATYSYFWPYWADCCDRNNIDLVLAGDHHVYMRSEPIYGGSALSGYSASNPNATVYLAADSSDGERGVAYSDTSFSETKANALDSSSLIASNYFRYDYTSSTKDMTSLLIHVGEDKITTNIVYYENSGSASASSDFYEGSVSGHSYFHYGDTSYVYPSDHGYNPGNNVVNPNVPAATKNYLSQANGGTYMYDTTAYPGGSSYYSVAYYGDNNSQGGSYLSGKLNNGVLPADSNPGSSNTDWAVLFASNGATTITLKLSSAIYLNNISVVYRAENGNYGNATVSGLQVSENGSSYSSTSAYTTKISTVSGSNSKITLNFNSAVKAKYIKFTVPKPSAGTRVAIGEIEVWGDTTLPVSEKPFELVEDSVHSMDDTYMEISTDALKCEELAAQFKCEVVVLSQNGAVMSSVAAVGTGCVVAQQDAAGNTIKSVTVVVLGDINGDAQLSSSDYLAVHMDISGSALLSAVSEKAADVSGSGYVDSIDYITMVSKLSGAIKSF